MRLLTAKASTKAFNIALLCATLFCAMTSAPLRAQTVDDGVMMPRHELFFGNIYTHDSWDEYWEGHLQRSNGNLGTVSTQSDSWYADYGVTNRLNVIVNLPYVWTNASQGVLSGMGGFQDVNLAAKYKLLERPVTKYGSLSVIGVVSGNIPLTNYEPDFQPLSIGNQSKRIAARLTLNYQTRRGWFGNASSAWTWRSDVTLDRPYYYTNGQFYLTNQVSMPQVFDYVVSAGWLKHGRMAEAFFTQQRTQGGGDIRRQDAPFISNHINFSKVGTAVMLPLPIRKLHNMSVQFAFSYVVDGRNVGQSTNVSTGLMYTLHLPGSPVQ